MIHKNLYFIPVQFSQVDVCVKDHNDHLITMVTIYKTFLASNYEKSKQKPCLTRMRSRGFFSNSTQGLSSASLWLPFFLLLLFPLLSCWSFESLLTGPIGALTLMRLDLNSFVIYTTKYNLLFIVAITLSNNMKWKRKKTNLKITILYNILLHV